MKFKYVNFDGSETISLIFTTGDCMPVTISPAHDAWKKFKEALLIGDPENLSEEAARDLLIKHAKAAKWYGSINDTVSIGLYSGVTVNGEPFEGPLADAITKIAASDNEDDGVYLQALARFLEKANSNPSMENSNVLYKWVMNEGLTITPDGDFIGYKAVRNYSIENPNDYVFPKGVKIRSSTVDGGGTVNGVDFPKYVPNWPGALVQMPRDKVDANGNTECSVGLHVGTYKYASGSLMRASSIMMVKVNPANVVAVSKDYNFQKIRSCEYLVVLDDVKSALSERLWVDEEFAPVSTEELSTDEKGTIDQIIQRLREASK